MKARLRFLFSVCLGLALAGAAAAQNMTNYSPPEPQCPTYSCTGWARSTEGPAQARSELAALVPAHTLAYLELAQTDKLAEEVRELFKGSVLHDPNRFVARCRRATNDDAAMQAMLATMLSPEILDELADCNGGLVALTGYGSDETPHVVAILRTGRSRLAPLALRFFLASDDGVKPVGRVEGVTIYAVGDKPARACCAACPVGPAVPRIGVNFDQPGYPPIPMSLGAISGPAVGAGTCVPACQSGPVSTYSARYCPAKETASLYVAQFPGAIVAGSTHAAVSDAIRRLKNKATSPSLADVPSFQEAATLRTGPGLFAYLDAPRTLRVVKSLLRPQLAEDKTAARQWKVAQAFLNPAAVRFVAGSWSLHKGEWRTWVEVRTHKGQTIPALEWMVDQKLSEELLRTVPRDAFYLLALPVSDKLRKAEFCEKIDGLHSAFWFGMMLPKGMSKEVDGLTAEDCEAASTSSGECCKASKSCKNLKLRLGKDVLGRTRTIALAGGLRCPADKEIECIPVVLIEATSPRAAQELEALWPRLHGMGKETGKPHRVKVGTETILSLAPKAGQEQDADGKKATGMPSYYARTGSMLVLGWQARDVAAALRAPKGDKPLMHLPLAQATAQQQTASLFFLLSGRQLLRQTCALLRLEDDKEARDVIAQLRRMCKPMKAMPPTMMLMQHEGNSYRCELRQSELKTASGIVLNGLLKLMPGCQTWSGGMTLPSATYLQHPPQCMPASPAVGYPVTPGGTTAPAPSAEAVTAPPTGEPVPTTEKKTTDTPKTEPKKTEPKKDSPKPTSSASSECCEPAAPAAEKGCSCPRTKSKKKTVCPLQP